MSAGIHMAREVSRGLPTAPPVPYFTGDVTSIVWPWVTVQPLTASVSGTQKIAFIGLVAPAVGDRVLCAQWSGEYVVLGILSTALGTSRVRISNSLGIDLANGLDFRMYAGALGSGTPVVELDGATGAAIFAAGVNSPFTKTYSNRTATTTSTTSNSTYATHITTNLVLPAGVWTVRVLGIGDYVHDTADTLVDQIIEIDGNPGPRIDNRVTLTGGTPGGSTAWASDHEVNGRMGTIPISVKYKNSTATTAVTASGAAMIMAAERTA